MKSCSLLLSLLLVLGTGNVWAQEYVPGEVIVKLKSNTSAGQQRFMGKAAGRMNVRASYRALAMMHMKAKGQQTVQELMDELKNDPDVEYVEPNYILRKSDDLVTDPNVYSYEEALDIIAQSGGGGGSFSQNTAPVRVTEAWAQMSASSAVTPIVAVIDTGVDYNHTVFVNSASIWQNSAEIASNGIDDDGNGYIDDVRGWNFYANNNNPMDDDDHGTHVAGIVLGVTQNIFASPLSAATIKIMPLKFLGADGSGTTSGAIGAIYYAINNGASVINNSWGGSGYSQALHDALKVAYDNQIVISSAAGNSANNNDAVAMYPANYPIPSQISVAATSDWDYVASFSNYGAASVHMAAPGVGIYSTAPSQGLKYMSGTSMAAPFVSGLAALAQREATQLTGYQIRNLIVNSGDYLSILQGKVSSQSRANALTVVQAALGQMSTQAAQPSYVAVAPALRSPSSEQSGGGCGTVTTLVNGSNPTKGSFSGMALAIAFTLLPLIVWMILRAQAQGRGRRKYDRFIMSSDIKVRIGDKELIGHMNTISVGGLSFKADAMLEKGGMVTMTIASPEGGEQIQVQGHIVWSEKNQAYGVQFDKAEEGIVQSIRGWSRHLVRAK